MRIATSFSVSLAAAAAIAAGSAAAQTTVLSPVVVKTEKDQGPRQNPIAPPSAPSAPPPPPNAFDALSTTSDKTAVTIYDSTVTTTVTTTAEIERQNATNPKDLTRTEPGISLPTQPLRGGASNFVIRGIGENRVRLEIDGVKVPDFPVTNIGSPTGYTRDFVDLDALKRVEIVRGPASALYGSDALGGVIAFVTKDPADYLALVNKDWFLSIKAGFDSTDMSLYSTQTGALRTGRFESMLVVTERRGHEIAINSKVRDANPQDYTTVNILGKIVYNAPNTAKLTLTGEYLTKSIGTHLRNEETPTVLSSFADDTNQRVRASLDWTSPVDWWLADAVKAKAYYTSVERQELSDQLRLSAGQQRLRLSDFEYMQSIVGADVQLSAKRQLGTWEHFITYGGSLDVTDTTRPRYRTETNLVTGVVSTTISGETFPNKNFPDTTTTQAAFFIQDIAQWGPWRLIPAVRFDFYDLKVHQDRLFANSNTGGFTINDQTEMHLSPKFGATYDLSNNFRLFAQYAHGFRAPPYDNANFGFRNPVFGYEILPNGNLKPETSDGLEAGLRGRFQDGSSFQLSYFRNKYKDFIDTVTVGVSPGGLLQFQYKNISNVTITGLEAKGEWRILPEWTLFSSLAWAIGENEDTGAPLDSVEPFKIVSGVRYKSSNSGWGGEVRGTWVAVKNRVSAPGIFVVPEHGTVDALVSYEIQPSFTINAGVFNIFNESYFNPADLAGVLASNPNLELFRAPGTTFAINSTIRW